MLRTLKVALVLLIAVALVTPVLAAGKGKGDRTRDRTRSCAMHGGHGTVAMADQARSRDQARDESCDQFVDDDGDGVCDNCPGGTNPDAPDADGDGIPNGQDPDYVPPQDGSGQQRGR
jgi:hypothetical protein